jgi:hypothetical protein
LLLAAAGFALASVPPAEGPAKASAVAYRLSGPFTHDNLTVFLLHGDDQVKGKKFLTLDEALKQKKIVVRETKNVQQLTIENVSASDEVFVQAGDIVKGGQQDRTVVLDLVIPPKSGPQPLPTFCVEQGRWNKRGGEDARSFSRSHYNLAHNQLKLAARKARAQGEVWKGVAKAQKELSMKVGSEVRAAASASSLQLTLENKKLLEALDAYVKKLQGSLDKQTDVVGYAVVINGKVNNADVYANADLFRKLWPKLLKASAVEAVTEKSDKTFTSAGAGAVKAFLADPEKGKRTQKATTKRFVEVQQETAKNVLFETRDEAGKGAVLRRSYLAK